MPRGGINAQHERRRSSARAELWGGIALAALGGSVTLLSYLDASLLGGFFAWKGACVAGLVLAISGWRRLRALRRAEELARDNDREREGGSRPGR